MPGGQSSVSVLITAEHASRSVPDEWAGLFSGREAVLGSHRAWDPGTRELATVLAGSLEAPLMAGEVTRLLVDLNRSLGHRQQFSEFTRGLSPSKQSLLIQRYWMPHWNGFNGWVERSRSGLLHIACHSFTPELNGRLRTADVGLLYDPGRSREQAFCRALGRLIQELAPELRVRMNYPYRGTANGLGQQHRRRFSETRLVTLELEINSALITRPDWLMLRDQLVEACRRVVQSPW